MISLRSWQWEDAVFFLATGYRDLRRQLSSFVVRCVSNQFHCCLFIDIGRLFAYWLRINCLNQDTMGLTERCGIRFLFSFLIFCLVSNSYFCWFESIWYSALILTKTRKHSIWKDEKLFPKLKKEHYKLEMSFLFNLKVDKCTLNYACLLSCPDK